jgi:SAM-dependent methyltransferase
MILGRDPENEAVVEDHMRRANDINELHQTMLSSPEFRARLRDYDLEHARVIEPSGPIKVQVKCNSHELENLLSCVQHAWTRMGKAEPMWSVLSEERFKSSEFPAHSTEFYESGRHDVDRYIAWLDRHGENRTRFDSCLEFGCGVGRMTAWIAGTVPHVIGCDISAVHLQLAEDYLRSEGIKNVELIHIDSFSKLEQLPAADTMCSIAVLQHNPPPAIAKIVDALLRRLNPEGVAYFQVPTYQLGYSFDLDEYLRSPRMDADQFEMHVLPQKHIFELAAANRCAVLEVQPDNYTRIANGISNTFLLKKSEPPGIAVTVQERVD